MYLNVFIVYLNVLKGIHSVFEYILMYLQYIYGIFECIYGVFECIYGVFECIYSIFMVYFNVFIICFNVFQCIKKNLNVFINIVIGISPLHSHCNVITMHTHIRICFSLSTMITFLTCYTTTFFSPIFIDLFQFIQFMKRLHINLYFSRLYITPHSIFHVVTS
jgi:hypothetical protein